MGITMYSDIKIKEKEIKIEDHGGRRMFSIKLSGLKEFEKRMLSESDCPFFLPMKFIKNIEDEWAYYDFTGCVQLSEYLKMKEKVADSFESKGKYTVLILDLIGDMLQCLKSMEKYLIFPDTVSVDPNLIFVDTESGRAILAYLTNTELEQALQKRIIDSIEKIIEYLNDAESKQFISNLVVQIKEKNPGLDGMISMIDKIKRELYYIYWQPENFRNFGTDSLCPEENLPGGNKEPVRITKFNKITSKKKWILSMAMGASILCLIGAYVSGLHDIESLAGLVILAAGANLMLYRKLEFNVKKG
jgi:hypothetical protein